jgi:hypothetical protein
VRPLGTLVCLTRRSAGIMLRFMKFAVIGAILVTLAQAQQPAHPVVFVDGNGSEQDAARETKHVRRDDQTMELVRDLLKSCPEISITRKEDGDLDYSLLFNRGDEYGLFKNAISQVMLLDRNKNVLYASKQGTVAKAAKDGCKAILEDWKKRRLLRSSADPAPAPLWNKQDQ